MQHHFRQIIRLCWLASLFILFSGLGSRLSAEDPSDLELHEWSVWAAEPQAKHMNGVADYTTAMPGLVTTERSRRRETGKPGPSPISLMTIYGTPPDVVDVDLRIAAGRPISQWPKSEGKANRLRWLDLTLSKELSNPELIAYIPDTHWFHRARELGGLYVQLKKGGRAERFFAYDLELQTPLNIRLDGGPDQYKIANLGKHLLHDILLMVPGSDGVRVGWLDTIAPAVGGAAAGAANPAEAPAKQEQPAGPAGGVAIRNVGGVVAVAAGGPNNNPGATPAQPATNAAANQPALKETITDITLEGPFTPESDEFKEKTSGEMRQRLATTGLKQGEINLIMSLYEQHFFATDEIHMIFRISPEGIDEITPLTVEPESMKVKRVALVIARKVDPKLREDVAKLIAELADTNYAKREQAEKRLRELGSLALPSLKEALKTKDLEVVMRAERILLNQKEQLGAEPNPAQ